MKKPAFPLVVFVCVSLAAGSSAWAQVHVGPGRNGAFEFRGTNATETFEADPGLYKFSWKLSGARPTDAIFICEEEHREEIMAAVANGHSPYSMPYETRLAAGAEGNSHFILTHPGRYFFRANVELPNLAHCAVRLNCPIYYPRHEMHAPIVGFGESYMVIDAPTSNQPIEGNGFMSSHGIFINGAIRYWNQIHWICPGCGGTGQDYSQVRDGREWHLCPLCANSLAHCAVCGKPTRGTGVPLPVCRFCERNAIKDPKELEQLWAQVQREVVSLFGAPVDCKPQLRLATGAELKEHLASVDKPAEFGAYLPSAAVGGQLTGASSSSPSSPAAQARPTCTILVLKGLPREYVRDTLAHELTHHWMAHHGRPLTPREEEGLCEYVAAVLDIFHKAPWLAKEKAANPNPDHADGFRDWVSMLGPPERCRTLASVRF